MLILYLFACTLLLLGAVSCDNGEAMCGRGYPNPPKLYNISSHDCKNGTIVARSTLAPTPAASLSHASTPVPTSNINVTSKPHLAPKSEPALFGRTKPKTRERNTRKQHLQGDPILVILNKVKRKHNRYMYWLKVIFNRKTIEV